MASLEVVVDDDDDDDDDELDFLGLVFDEKQMARTSKSVAPTSIRCPRICLA